MNAGLLLELYLRVLVALSASLFVYCLFNILLKRGKGRRATSVSRMEEIARFTSEPDMQEDQGKKKRRNSKFRSEKLRKRFRQMEDQLYDVGIEMPVKDFIMFWVGSMAILSVAMSVLGVNLIISVTIIFAAAMFPALLIRSKRRKRCSMIEDQLLDAIQILSNALKVGYSFTQAMQNIVKEMDGPIAEEFGRVFMETQHGMNLEDSLEAMCSRVGSEDLSMMCMAVEIQHQVGGNLSEILTNISETIKGRLRLKADVKVKTASGRISGIIIGALPILLFVMFLVINPGYMEFFSAGIGGYICVLFCVIMEAVGFVVINKIITIKY